MQNTPSTKKVSSVVIQSAITPLRSNSLIQFPSSLYGNRIFKPIEQVTNLLDTVWSLASLGKSFLGKYHLVEL